MTAPAIKSVTKAVLSGFVREHSALNLTQAKAITDRLLAEFIVTVKPPPDPSTYLVEPGQLWLHAPSNKVLRVSDVESGPIYVPGDPVTSWGPLSVSWEDTADGTIAGSTEIQLWREQARPLSEADETMPGTAEPTTSTTPTTQESETTPVSEHASTPTPKLYALVSKKGTAMSETVLTEDEFTPANQRQTKAEAPSDWDGGDFHDVSDNDALRAALEDDEERTQ